MLRRLALVAALSVLTPPWAIVIGHWISVLSEIAHGQVTVYYFSVPKIGTSEPTCLIPPTQFAVFSASQSVVTLPSAWAANGLERARAAGRQSPEALRNCIVFDRLNWTCDGPTIMGGYGGWLRMTGGHADTFIAPPINPPMPNIVSAISHSVSWVHYRLTCGYSYEFDLYRRQSVAQHLGWW